MQVVSKLIDDLERTPIAVLTAFHCTAVKFVVSVVTHGYYTHVYVQNATDENLEEVARRRLETWKHNFPFQLQLVRVI